MQKFPKDELLRRIDEVLFYIWDPIGVGPDPNARREYSNYSKIILNMLDSGRDKKSIINYLMEAETGLLSLPANQLKCEKVAELIFKNRDAIDNGRA
jgi:hypothetical protein